MTATPGQLAAAHRHLARQQLERDRVAATGVGGEGLAAAGPPTWSRDAWESFKAKWGHYPYGPQKDGGVVYPPTFEGAPDWVFVLMGIPKRPPITVTTSLGENPLAR